MFWLCGLSAGPCDSETTPARMEASAGYVYRSARTRALGSEVMACVCGMGCTRQPSRSGYFGGETVTSGGDKLALRFSSPVSQSHPFPCSNQSLDNTIIITILNTHPSPPSPTPPQALLCFILWLPLQSERINPVPHCYSRISSLARSGCPENGPAPVGCIRATVPPISFQNVSRTSLHSCIV